MRAKLRASAANTYYGQWPAIERAQIAGRIAGHCPE